MDLLGNDLYMIKETKMLRSDELDSLMNLYQPLLSSRALCLYFSLLKMPVSSQMYDTHSNLCTKMNCSINELLVARKELEHYLLLNSYYTNAGKNKVFVYDVVLPKTPLKFLKHDVFSRLLVNVVGNDYVERIIKNQNELHDFSKLENITELMQISFDEWNDFKEDCFQNTISEINDIEESEPYKMYDILGYLKRTDPSAFKIPWDKMSQNDFVKINKLGQRMMVDYNQMLIVINQAINRTTFEMDYDTLQSLCAKYSKVEFVVDINDNPMNYALAIHPKKFLTQKEQNEIVAIINSYGNKVANNVINNAIAASIANTTEHHVVRTYVEKVIESTLHTKKSSNTKKTTSYNGKLKRVEEIPNYNYNNSNIEAVDEAQIKANLELLSKLEG